MEIFNRIRKDIKRSLAINCYASFLYLEKVFLHLNNVLNVEIRSKLGWKFPLKLLICTKFEIIYSK